MEPATKSLFRIPMKMSDGDPFSPNLREGMGSAARISENPPRNCPRFCSLGGNMVVVASYHLGSRRLTTAAMLQMITKLPTITRHSLAVMYRKSRRSKRLFSIVHLQL